MAESVFSVSNVSTLGAGASDSLSMTTPSVLSWALAVLGFIAATVFLFGFATYIFARTNDDHKDDGKRMMFAALVGGGIVMIAWAVVSIVTSTTTNTPSNINVMPQVTQ